MSLHIGRHFHQPLCPFAGSTTQSLISLLSFKLCSLPLQLRRTLEFALSMPGCACAKDGVTYPQNDKSGLRSSERLSVPLSANFNVSLSTAGACGKSTSTPGFPRQYRVDWPHVISHDTRTGDRNDRFSI